MTKFEYKNVLDDNIIPIEILQQYGDDGWELVQILQNINSTPYCYYFKREKSSNVLSDIKNLISSTPSYKQENKLTKTFYSTKGLTQITLESIKSHSNLINKRVVCEKGNTGTILVVNPQVITIRFDYSGEYFLDLYDTETQLIAPIYFLTDEN